MVDKIDSGELDNQIHLITTSIIKRMVWSMMFCLIRSKLEYLWQFPQDQYKFTTTFNKETVDTKALDTDAGIKINQ